MCGLHWNELMALCHLHYLKQWPLAVLLAGKKEAQVCLLWSYISHTLAATQLYALSGSLLGPVLLFFVQPIRSHLLLLSSTLLLHSCQSSLTKQGRGDFKRLCCLVFPPISLFLKPRVKLQRYWDDNTESSKGLMLCVSVRVGVHAPKNKTGRIVNAVCVFAVCTVSVYKSMCD